MPLPAAVCLEHFSRHAVQQPVVSEAAVQPPAVAAEAAAQSLVVAVEAAVQSPAVAAEATVQSPAVGPVAADYTTGASVEAVSANQWTGWSGGGFKPEVEVKPEMGVNSIKSPDSIKGSAMPRIRAALSARGKKIVWVEDKGDCLFLACSGAIWGDTEVHQTLKQHSVDELETHSDSYSPFMEEDEPFEAHCARMRRQRQWGGMIQLQAIAELTQRVIIVYRSNEPKDRPISTRYAPQRQLPIGSPVEILYDWHYKHYWYV